MIEKELAQLKLADGHEIVCEVVEWPEKGDDQIVIRNAMSIVVLESHDGESAYVFRPFIHFLETNEDFILLNSGHVMSMNRPKEYLSEQYDLSVISMLETNKERVDEYNRSKVIGTKRIVDALMDIYENDGEESDETKTKSNVISFPDPDIIH